MKTEQFIYGLFKNYGIKLIKSPELNSLLTSEIIDYLTHIEKVGIHQNLWPNGVITITHIHKTNDEYGRDGVWNHTFAFKLMDWLQLTNPEKVFRSRFIEKLDAPKPLESVKVESL